jgi:transposase
MRRAESLQGVRMIKFRNVFERYEASELNQIDAAAALLGITERTFRRWCVRFEDGEEASLLDRRLGQASGRRVPTERERQIETLRRTRCSGFTARHFHEHLVSDHGFSWGYTWTTVFLQSKGVLSRAETRGANQRKRPRLPWGRLSAVTTRKAPCGPRLWVWPHLSPHSRSELADQRRRRSDLTTGADEMPILAPSCS